MSFDMKAYQAEYRKKKKEEREKMKNEKLEEPKESPETSKDPDLSMNEEVESEKEKTESKPKVVQEKIKSPPKKGKKGMKTKISLNPEAFGNFSVGIEKTTLLIHKDKDLKPHEEQLIRTSAEQLAAIYEMPTLIIIIQYISAMILPHVTRLISAQAEKLELENESKKIDLEEKKRKIEEGKQKLRPEDVYSSVMGKNGN
jgi:hypothetical protein